ncbi:MAG TPA: 6-phospho-3-hexuloisomerase [Nocardioidaceae bacterium]|nr:6-phospho-3-hexuloisomerase [Nocardioidaceae bacterium]
MTDEHNAEKAGSADPLDTVLTEITQVLAKVSRPEVEDLGRRLGEAGRIFIAGEGRSGLMAKAFAMRLMHLGSTVHVLGETTTPSVAAGDTMVAISGSGKTEGTVRAAEAAQRVGAGVLVVSTDPSSPLARAAEAVLTVPAATKYRRADEPATIQPLSSLFDQATHIVLDVVCLQLAEQRRVDNETARAAHSNME